MRGHSYEGGMYFRHHARPCRWLIYTGCYSSRGFSFRGRIIGTIITDEGYIYLSFVLGAEVSSVSRLM